MARLFELTQKGFVIHQVGIYLAVKTLFLIGSSLLGDASAQVCSKRCKLRFFIKIIVSISTRLMKYQDNYNID